MVVRKAHRAFQSVILLDDVVDLFTVPKRLPSDETLRPCPVPINGDRIIAAMHQPLYYSRLKTGARMAAANRNVESARVAVKIRMFRQHLAKISKVFRVCKPAFGRAMRG